MGRGRGEGGGVLCGRGFQSSSRATLRKLLNHDSMLHKLIIISDALSYLAQECAALDQIRRCPTGDHVGYHARKGLATPRAIDAQGNQDDDDLAVRLPTQVLSIDLMHSGKLEFNKRPKYMYLKYLLQFKIRLENCKLFSSGNLR